jgi:hypothetical protein
MKENKIIKHPFTYSIMRKEKNTIDLTVDNSPEQLKYKDINFKASKYLWIFIFLIKTTLQITPVTNPGLFTNVGNFNFGTYNVSDIYTVNENFLVVGNWNANRIRFYSFDVDTPPYFTQTAELSGANCPR